MKKKSKKFVYITLIVGVFFAISDKYFASVKSITEAENKSWEEIFYLIPGYFILAAIIAYIIIDYSKYDKDG